MKEVDAEATHSKEWVLYDDRLVKNVDGNWTEIVENLVRAGGYPTILLYEKLEPTDQHKGEAFQIKEKDLNRIVGDTIAVEK